MDWLAYPAVGSAAAGILIYIGRKAFRWFRHRNEMYQAFNTQVSQQLRQVVQLCERIDMSCPRYAEHEARLGQIEKDVADIKHFLFARATLPNSMHQE